MIKKLLVIVMAVLGCIDVSPSMGASIASEQNTNPLAPAAESLNLDELRLELMANLMKRAFEPLGKREAMEFKRAFEPLGKRGATGDSTNDDVLASISSSSSSSSSSSREIESSQDDLGDDDSSRESASRIVVGRKYHNHNSRRHHHHHQQKHQHHQKRGFEPLGKRNTAVDDVDANNKLDSLFENLEKRGFEPLGRR